MSSDVSERTLRNLRLAAKSEPLRLPLDQYQLERAVGARFVAAAVTDQNFVRFITSSVNEEA